MNCDYTGPNYSPEDLRSVIDAMCKSLESSGQIDEHEHPSAYSTLLDTAKWMAELEGQEPVAWVYDWQAPEGLIKGWVETNRDAIPEHATNIRPLYARPAPAEPVNARLLDVAVWPAGYCRDPNGKMSIPAGKEEDFNFGYDVGFQEAWEILNSAISAAGKSPTSQQERLLQDMHDAGREIDRVMAEAAPKVVRLTEAQDVWLKTLR